jgi:hypothetical protein
MLSPWWPVADDDRIVSYQVFYVRVCPRTPGPLQPWLPLTSSILRVELRSLDKCADRSGLEAD